jgi:hypothetical protein
MIPPSQIERCFIIKLKLLRESGGNKGKAFAGLTKTQPSGIAIHE